MGLVASGATAGVGGESPRSSRLPKNHRRSIPLIKCCWESAWGRPFAGKITRVRGRSIEHVLQDMQAGKSVRYRTTLRGRNSTTATCQCDRARETPCDVVTYVLHLRPCPGHNSMELKNRLFNHCPMMGGHALNLDQIVK